MLDKNKSIVLFSGGQDSSACLLWALSKFEEVQTIGFDYGQRHNIELECRINLLKRIQLHSSNFLGKLSNDIVINLTFTKTPLSASSNDHLVKIELKGPSMPSDIIVNFFESSVTLLLKSPDITKYFNPRIASTSLPFLEIISEDVHPGIN